MALELVEEGANTTDPIKGAELTLQQKQAIAIAQARARVKARVEAGRVPEAPAHMRFAGQANRAIAEAAGAPVDIVNLALSKAGMGSEEPVGGSESIKKFFGTTGVETATQPPEGFIEQAGGVTGEAASFLIPFMKGAQALGQTSGTAGRVGRAITEEFVERPGRALAFEAAAVPGIAEARDIAQLNELSPAASIPLEILGGATPAAATRIVTTPSRTAIKLGVWGMAPFTEKGAMARASRSMQNLVGGEVGAQKAVAMIEDLKGTNLSPSARTDNPSLMALENTVLSLDPAELARVSQKRSETMEQLANTIRQSGNVRDAKSFLQAKRDRLNASIDVRIEKAADDAKISLENLQPANREEANAIVRDALETALADARVQERQLWSAIPQEVEVPLQNTFTKFSKIQNDLSLAQMDDIPAIANKLIGGNIIEGKFAKGITTNVREIDGLYKRLGEEATIARAAGEFNKARIAEELRTSIVDDLDSIKAQGGVADQIKTARAFSRDLNQKFRTGAVGKIMGFSREGGQGVPTDLTLKGAIGMGQEKAKVGLESLQRATQDPNLMEGVSQYLKAEFMRDAVDPNTGLVKPAQTDTFFRKFGDVLDAVPATRDQIRAAKSADDVARRVTKEGDAFRKDVDNPNISPAATLLNEPVETAMPKIFQMRDFKVSADAPKALKEITRLARMDKTGKAVNGLRAGVSEFLVNSITTPSGFDDFGRPTLNGMKLERMLKDPNMEKSLLNLFSKKELDGLKHSAMQMTRIQKLSTMKGAVEIMADKPGWLVDRIGRIMGARVGGQLGGKGAIQSAGMASESVKKFLNGLTSDKARQLVIDAMQKPDLMKSLLTHKNGKVSKRQERIIRNYMLSTTGSRLADQAVLELAEEEKKRERK
jgi:hypothetical protein